MKMRGFLLLSRGFYELKTVFKFYVYFGLVIFLRLFITTQAVLL